MCAKDDKATVVASDSFKPDDPLFGLEETLYKKPDGSYYLEGKGGTLTKWRGSKNKAVLIITDEQALTWLNSHYDTLTVGE